MQVSEDFAMDDFLRSWDKPFTLKDFTRRMREKGFNLNQDESDAYLAESPYVFQVESGEFLTRAAVFTGKYFSFTLIPEEIKNKMFVPGHRFMPFVDEMQNPAAFTFVCNGEKLKTRVGEFRKETVLDLYRLFGEEYEVQYIASDPALVDLDLAALDFELPSRVKITGCDLSYFIDNIGLTVGDRILCRVINWDKGVIEIKPIHKERENDSGAVQIEESDRERILWCDKFEKSLIKIIETEGPCTTIEEQLAFTFFDNLETLCTENCDSVENFLAHSKKIGLEFFGVETRLWYKNQIVPAIGSWNGMEMEKDPGELQNLTFKIPEYILDSYLKDFEYGKEKDLTVLMKRMFPVNFALTNEEKKYVFLHIAERYAIIKKRYNYFADYPVGAIRKQALSLYSRVSALVYDVESSSAQFNQFPQQELVILSQLFTHINRILESINSNPDAAVEDETTLELSIEGMECNYEDIADAIRYVVEKQRRNDFTVV